MAKAEESKKAEKTAEFKYTVDNLVTDTGLQKPSIRIGLRESDFKKTGASWGWNTKADYEAVLKFFKERSARRPDLKAKPAPTRKAKDEPKADAPKEEGAEKPRRRKAAA